MNDKTLTALCEVLDETGADYIEWKITTVEDKKITIKVERIENE